MTKFKLNELFAITTKSDLLFPFNLEFKPTKKASKELNEICLFYLFYKGELLYIGEGNPTRKLETTIKRIQKQLSTITLRGHDVQFRKGHVTAIQTNSQLSIFMPEEILSNRKTSAVTSYNRIHFAAEHWETFAFLETKGLSDFSLIVKNLAELGITEDQLKEKCDSEKKKFIPRCNNEFDQVFNHFQK